MGSGKFPVMRSSLLSSLSSLSFDVMIIVMSNVDGHDDGCPGLRRTLLLHHLSSRGCSPEPKTTGYLGYLGCRIRGCTFTLPLDERVYDHLVAKDVLRQMEDAYLHSSASMSLMHLRKMPSDHWMSSMSLM